MDEEIVFAHVLSTTKGARRGVFFPPQSANRFDNMANVGSLVNRNLLKVARLGSISHVASTDRMVFVGLTRDPISIDDALLHKRGITVYANCNSVYS